MNGVKQERGMIKVMFITYNLGSGGAEKVFQILMNNLDRKKFVIQCIIINRVLHNAYLENDIALHELHHQSSFKALYKVRRIIKTLKPDIVIGTITPINIILPIIKATLPRRNKPIFLVRESTVMSCLAKDAGFKNMILKNILSHVYPQYDYIVCQSNDIKTDLIENFGVPPAKLKLINNPIEINVTVLRDVSRNGKVKFITVGRLRPEKGHTRILEALKLYEKRFSPDFEYHIIGDFATVTMEQLIFAKVDALGLKEKIIFHGHLDNPGVILEGCDVFLQGSYFEGFPNAVLESCSLGVPVVAYDVAGGTKEIIRPGFNGYLSPDFNVEDYVSRMHDASNTDFDRVAMLEDIRHRFSHEKIVRLYEDFFLSLVKNA